MEASVNKIILNDVEKRKPYTYTLIQLSKDIFACSNTDCISIWTSDIKTPERIKNPSHVGNSFILLLDGRLASGSGLTIQLFQPITYKLDSTLTGHNGIVICLLQLKDSRLLSSSLDQSFKVWDINTYQCALTVSGLDKISRCLIELDDNKIVSCSYYNTIKVWNTEFTSTMVINKKAYSMLKLTNGLLAIGLKKAIEIWDIKVLNCIKTIKTIIPGIVKCLFTLNEDHFACCSLNLIVIWNNDYMYKGKLKDKKRIVHAIQLAQGDIVSIDIERNISFWEGKQFVNGYHKFD